jgi:uncharacterized peroxidase-related enzyme
MEIPMPSIQPLDPRAADGATAESLAAVKAKLGMVPNMFATMARAPAALQGYLQFSGALGAGRLSMRQREAIALAVAQENACGYCLAAHSALGRMAGMGDADLAAARAASGATPEEAALTALARAVVRSRGNPSKEELSAFRARGFGDADLLEVIANVALNVYTNYLNHIAGTEIDFPKVDLKLAA